MSTDKPIRILTVDDHPLVREGIAMVIGRQSDLSLIGQACDGRDGVHQHKEKHPDVTLMDLRLPDISGIEALSEIRRATPTARVIMLSSFETDIEIRRSLEAGARGFLLKSMPPSEIVAAVRRVNAGQRCMPSDLAMRLADHIGDDTPTAREAEILSLVANGHRNRDIAQALSISEDTVKAHVRHVMQKLGAASRTDAVMIAVRRGILQP
jgi:DNA-binding NarL/FixJ family response regulator